MNRVTVVILSSLLALSVAEPAAAIVSGDEIEGTLITSATGANNNVFLSGPGDGGTPATATIGAGFEFDENVGPNRVVADFDPDTDVLSLALDLNAPQSGLDLSYRFDELDPAILSVNQLTGTVADIIDIINNNRTLEIQFTNLDLPAGVSSATFEVTSVPFETETGLGLLASGLIFGGLRLRKRMMSHK